MYLSAQRTVASIISSSSQFIINMQSKSTVKNVGNETAIGSLSGVESNEIGAVEILGQSYSKSNDNDADDAILRAQGHKAAMPRLFSIVSTMGLMFWYAILGLIGSITIG